MPAKRATRREFLGATGAMAGAVIGGGLIASAAEAASPAVVLAAGPRPGGQSALRQVTTSPALGAQGVCVDTQLAITFDGPPRIGTAGKIRVVRADGTVADTIDLAAATQSRFIGAAPQPFNYHPVIVSGNVAAITPHQALAYGQAYHVLIDPGVFVDASGQPFPGISDPSAWQFRTKAAAPPAGTAALTVDAAGGGDFCTVQGAIDFVPAGNKRLVSIDVRAGTYTEIVYVGPTRPFITVRGDDRNLTVIQYANNNNLNGSSTFRALFGVDASDFTLENLTLHNTTPEGGSQAEAFRGSAQRIFLSQVNLRSRQDTIRLDGAGLVADSYLEGDVDFTWGNGGAFFDRCEIRALHRTVGSGDIFAQIRNTQTTHGNVYLHCRLTGPDLTSADTAFLARIDPTRFPFSQVVYIGCAMDSHIAPAGWQLNNASTAPNVQFWEHGSTDLNGKALDLSRRASFSKQLTDAQAAQWSDPKFVLGWAPPGFVA